MNVSLYVFVFEKKKSGYWLPTIQRYSRTLVTPAQYLIGKDLLTIFIQIGAPITTILNL